MGQRDSGKLLFQLARLDLIGRQLAILVVSTQLPSMLSGRTQYSTAHVVPVRTERQGPT